MKIKNCKVSGALKFFKNKFLKKYSLIDNINPYEPAIFFGCYGIPNKKETISRDIKNIFEHKSLGVIVWGGTDAYNIKNNNKYFKYIFSMPNIKHIAISKYISEDLNKYNVKHYVLPICPTYIYDNVFTSSSCGDNIYSYSSHSSPDLYGENIISELKIRLPNFKFIIGYANGDGYYSDIKSIYEKCFMGLRLTKHDGLPNTVIEMGLMGRRCIWNGGELPNALQWKNIDDIINIIEVESKFIGKENKKLSQNVYDYLNIDNKWLDTEFYK